MAGFITIILVFIDLLSLDQKQGKNKNEEFFITDVLFLFWRAASALTHGVPHVLP